MTVADLLSLGLRELKELGTEEAKASTERLIEALLQWGRSSIYLQSEHLVREESVKIFESQLSKRKARIPLAYILGKAYFWNECLSVGSGCLIPRPETEILVEEVAKIFTNSNQSFHFLDIGTGSGAIAIALLRMYPNASGTLLDISSEALGYARKNIEEYGLTARAGIICSDLFSNIAPHPIPLPVLRGEGKGEGIWDLIVSNPPYINHEDLKRLQPEIASEPQLALDGGPDGLDFYRRLLKEAPGFLKENGWLVFEVGIHQAEKIEPWLSDFGFKHAKTCKDFSDINRVVIAQLI